MNEFEPDPTTQEPPPPSGGPAVGESEAAATFEAALARIIATGEPTGADLPDRLCRALVDGLDVDGAAISVYLGGDVAVPVGASDLEATTGEALQFTLREGPCFDSYRSRSPVLATDLAAADAPAWSSWPTYTAELLRRTSFRAVFAYPLLARGIAMGSLSLYRRSDGAPHPLGAATVAARMATRLLEAELIVGLDGEPEHRWMDGPVALRRRQVWLAQGLVLQANRVTPSAAIDLLRARAFTADRLLDDVAADIVAGRLPPPTLDSRD